MKYNPNDVNGYVSALFEGEEVEAVRRAFEENNARLKALGNDSSVSEVQKKVATWIGIIQRYRAPKAMQLIEPLNYFVEATEDKVDELLDESPAANRIEAAGKRYKFGYLVDAILIEIEQHESGEAVSSVD